MIKNVHIENFRNLKSQDLSFDQMTSIITGKNNIGKSNTLNAIMWFLTDTLLTDKWGTGENELSSIIPTTHQKGEHTLVTVTLDSGAEFSKIYKRGYDKTTGKANKHTTEYRINGALCANSTEFTNALFGENQLSFMPHIKNAKGIKELNLMIDPLYALQKLDNKSLRLLLVELGCSVTNEEVFESNKRFEVLREKENKYLGDFSKMRLDLKQKKKLAEDDIKAAEVLLASVNDVEEYDDTNLVNLEEELTEKKVKIQKLEQGDIESLIKDLTLQKQRIELEKKSFIETESAKNQAQISILNEKRINAKEKAEKAKFEKLNELNKDISRLSLEQQSLVNRKLNYENTWNNCKKDYSKNLVDTDNLNNDLANAKARILEANERTFQGFVKCPHCGETFASDQAAYDNFNKHKTNDITYWQNKVSEIEIKIIEMTKSRDKIANMGKESKAQIDELISQISEYDSKIETIKSQINDTYGIQVDYTEVQKLDQEIQTLNNKAIDCGKYNNELNQIQAAIDKTILDSKQANAEELDKLENEVDEIKSSLEEEYIKKSKWASKAKYQQQLHEYNNKLNDIEYELELVSDFMQTMISMINAKAKDITGIDFVMLEENLGNDNLKEVCYATVDGVPFDSVNTSQKLEVGIKFIERIKKILGENQLPILADRLEGFDSVNTIKALTSEQLICTRVGSDDMQNITII